ncbi:MAG: hypothetical protein SFY95_03055 [Planctomycetota bacterium]|nr:hypothetical protein [Planctomycetota bacterium]
MPRIHGWVPLIGLTALASATSSTVAPRATPLSLPRLPTTATSTIAPDVDPAELRAEMGQSFEAPAMIQDWIGEPLVQQTRIPGKLRGQFMLSNRVTEPRPWPRGSEPAPLRRTLLDDRTNAASVVVRRSPGASGSSSAPIESRSAAMLFAALADEVSLEAAGQVGPGGSLSWSEPSIMSSSLSLAVNPCWSIRVTLSADELGATGQLAVGLRTIWVSAREGQAPTIASRASRDLRLGAARNHIQWASSSLQEMIQSDCATPKN